MQKNIQSGLQNLMQKDMDRKDFIKHVGIGVVALTGVAAVLRTVTQTSLTAPQKSTNGFGSGVYGGGTTVSRTTQPRPSSK